MGTDSLHRQLIQLGDMMGDGLHLEEPWIAKEYRRVSKLLNPEIYSDIRKAKANRIQVQMEALMAKRKCKCGGSLAQKRRGTKVCYCTACNARHEARKSN